RRRVLRPDVPAGRSPEASSARPGQVATGRRVATASRVGETATSVGETVATAGRSSAGASDSERGTAADEHARVGDDGPGRVALHDLAARSLLGRNRWGA